MDYGMYDSVSVNPVLVIVWIAVFVLMLVANWKIYTKAGKPGCHVLWRAR